MEEYISTDTLIEQCLTQGKIFEKQGKFVQSKLFYEVALRLKELDFIDKIDHKHYKDYVSTISKPTIFTV
jgi:hypothetical protein